MTTLFYCYAFPFSFLAPELKDFWSFFCLYLSQSAWADITKISQTGWLTTEIYWSHFWKLENQHQGTGRFCLVRTHFLVHRCPFFFFFFLLSLLMVGLLRGLYHKGVNPIHEGFALRSQLFSQEDTPKYHHIGGLRFNK